MEQSPSVLNRLADSCLGVVPGVGFIAYVVQADSGVARVGGGLAVVGFGVLAVRGYRLGVTCEHSRMVIRGYLRTRVIERQRILEITDFPAVRWTPRGGGKRWTPLTPFMTSSGEVAASRLSKERAVRKVRRWVRCEWLVRVASGPSSGTLDAGSGCLGVLPASGGWPPCLW